MSVVPDAGSRADHAWSDALLAAACIAVDPAGLGGVRVHAAAGPVRDAWLATWRGGLAASTPVRTVPLRIDDDRLLGGLDLAASLRAGRPIAQPGLLSEVDGGYAVLAMAERIDAATAAQIASTMESGTTGREARDAPSRRTRFGVIVLDESGDDERVAGVLDERVGLVIDLRAVSLAMVDGHRHARGADIVAAARQRLPSVRIDDDAVSALCETAVTLGIRSLRMPRFALCAARAIAALDDRDVVDADDAARAARLVYAQRVRQLPAADQTEESAQSGEDEGPSDENEGPPDENERPQDQSESSQPPPADGQGGKKEDDVAEPASREGLDDVVLDATLAAIPAGLLARLANDAGAQRSAAAARGSGALGQGRGRGVPAGVRRGRPRAPERLGLVETLRAAAPWQRIRRAELVDRARADHVQVRAEDLHVVRFKQRHPTTTVFVVDASGSSALHRLAEAKGALELLLADCYVRRDQVAVLAFRGKSAELLLAPTRSLVRARRGLAGLPGGGGTPLASALDATRDLVVSLRRRGDTVLVVLLTDGRANVARDGRGGRPQAEADALASARGLQSSGARVLLIDTSPQPYPQAARLAEAMGGVYRALPHAGAAEMSAVVRRSARAAA